LELFEQYDVDGHAAGDVITAHSFLLFVMAKILEFESVIYHVNDQFSDQKDCLMSPHTDDALWFNIDIPKGHQLKAGDRVRVTVEKI
jgi:hypothetical protein